MSKQHGDKHPNPEIMNIDPRGDVMLKVYAESLFAKGEPPKCYLLRVSSKVLSLASAPIRSMFSADYLEGQNLSADNPPTVELPDDNAKGTLNLCVVLHYHPVPDIQNVLEYGNGFLEMVIVAHKYDCLRALHATLRLFMKRVQDVPHDDIWAQTLAVSYLSDSAWEFYCHTAALVFKVGSIQDVLLTSERFVDVAELPRSLWLTLAGRVERVHSKMFKALREVANLEACSLTRNWENTRAKVIPSSAQNFTIGLHELLTEAESAKIPLLTLLQALRKDHDAYFRMRLKSGHLPRLSRNEQACTEKLEACLNFQNFTQVLGLCLKCVKTEQIHPTICRGCEKAGDPLKCQGCDGRHGDN